MEDEKQLVDLNSLMNSPRAADSTVQKMRELNKYIDKASKMEKEKEAKMFPDAKGTIQLGLSGLSPTSQKTNTKSNKRTSEARQRGIVAEDLQPVLKGSHVVNLSLDYDPTTGVSKDTGMLKLRVKKGENQEKIKSGLNTMGITVTD